MLVFVKCQLLREVNFVVNLIKQVSTDGIEFYTIEEDGRSGISQSGIAVLCGESQQTISNIIKSTLTGSVQSKWLKPFINKKLTLTSFSETDSIFVNGRPQGNLEVYNSSFVYAVIKHYAFSGNEVAQYSMDKFGEKGINSWIQDITGWSQQKNSVPNIPQHTSVYIKRLENSRDHIIDYQYWAVFQEADWVYLMVEREWKVPVEQFDLLDGSIGRKWSNYREDKSWAMPLGEYTHVFRDKRPSVVCNAFDHKELSHFKEWLDKVYVPQHLPEYLVSKFGRKATRLIYTENGHLTDEILHLTEIKRETQNMINQFQQFLLLRENLLRLSD